MGGLLETTLRNDLRRVMGDQLDEQLINGSGTSPNISGVFNELTDATDATTVVDFDSFRLTGTNELDGKMANTEASIRIWSGWTLGRRSGASRTPTSSLTRLRLTSVWAAASKTAPASPIWMGRQKIRGVS